MTSEKSRLTYEPCMWIHEGGTLVSDDEHAFRYKVFDERHAIVGFITADRDRNHPSMKWLASHVINDGVDELAGQHATIDDALLELEREIGRSRWRVS